MLALIALLLGPVEHANRAEFVADSLSAIEVTTDEVWHVSLAVNFGGDVVTTYADFQTYKSVKEYIDLLKDPEQDYYVIQGGWSEECTEHMTVDVSEDRNKLPLLEFYKLWKY